MFEAPDDQHFHASNITRDTDLLALVCVRPGRNKSGFLSEKQNILSKYSVVYSETYLIAFSVFV